MRALKVLAVAVPASVALSGCEDAAPPPLSGETVRPVMAARVGDAETLIRRSFSGRARAAREVDLAFRVSGPLSALPIKVGDAVRKGDAVARLDPAPFRVEADEAEASLARARATHRNAEIELKRSRTLFKQGHVAEARFDQDRVDAEVTAAEAASAEAVLARARLNLDYTVLKAPFDGVVVATYVENFEEIRAGQSIVRVVNADRIEMVVDVPEGLIAMTPMVKTVTVVFDAFPDRPLTATVGEIGTEASASTRTYPVTLVMDPPTGMAILPGMAGRTTEAVLKDGAALEGGIDIPLSAAFNDGVATYIWLIDPGTGTVSRRRIEPLSVVDLGLRVASGLGPGDLIVTAGVHSLREGQKVRVLDSSDDGGAGG